MMERTSTYVLTASFLKGSAGVFLCWTVKDLPCTCISRSSNSSSCSRTGILDLQISNSETATAATKGSLKKEHGCILGERKPCC
ncbi:hypothetical protein P8452_23442 [Trifolium repens]|nr:hypothetical protein P8452_23442 [Trifolium repens]